MRTPNRDRCRSAVFALCIAFALITVPAGALSAEFQILENGTAYRASMEITGTEHGFWEQGMLGERVPLGVEDLQVIGADGPVDFTWRDGGTITFPEGNYTATYRGAIRNNHLQALFNEPYTVTVTLPEGLDVRNPLLAMISPGGGIGGGENDTLTVAWSRTTYIELRFYDPGREILLNTFVTIWVVMAVVLLFPYLLTRLREE